MIANRRYLIRTLIAGSIFSPGCGREPAYDSTGPSRGLTLYLSAGREVPTGWELTLHIYQLKTFTGNQNINEAVLIGYSTDGKIVCEREVGTIRSDTLPENPLEIKITCSSAPRIITFDTAHSICNDEIATGAIILEKANGSLEQLPGTCFRQCGEGLPPDIERCVENRMSFPTPSERTPQNNRSESVQERTVHR